MKFFADKVGFRVYDTLVSTRNVIIFLGETAAAFVSCILHPTRIRRRETLYYMNMCGFDALPIVFLICYLMGLILGINGAFLLKEWGTEVYIADMIGLIIVKELGPLMVAIVATGRSGTAFAAEIGTMKVNEEVDAMTTMGLGTSRFLVIPKLIAMIITMPLLTVFGNFAGLVGGFSIGFFTLNIPAVTYYHRTIEAVTVGDFFEGIIKTICFAVLITVIGCMSGFQAESDAQSVGRSATSAVVRGIFVIIVCDAILTLIFNIF